MAAQIELGAHLCGLIGRCVCGHEPYDIPTDKEKGTRLLTEAAAQSSGRAYYLLSKLNISIWTQSDADMDEKTKGMSLLIRAGELGDPDATVLLKGGKVGSSMNADVIDPTLKADHAIGRAIESGDMDKLRQAIQEHQGAASHDVLEEGRRVREKWKKRARKQRNKEVGE